MLPPPGLELWCIAGGLAHRCGIEPDGGALCWGLDVTLADPYPQPPAGTYLEIDSAEGLTCAQRPDQTLACWFGPFLDATVDVTPPEGVAFTDFSVGGRHACGLTTEGEILCWGHEIAGELHVPL